MSFSLILGMAAAAASGDFRTYLTGHEVVDFGVTLSSHELEYEGSAPPFPTYFALDVSNVQDCNVTAVGIQVQSESKAELFGTTISGAVNDIYAFRLSKDFISATSLAIRCGMGPDQLDKVYIFDIEDALKAP